MKLDIDKLKGLAEAATPGPWINHAPGEVATEDYLADGQTMCDHIASGFGCGASDPDDAAFVAAANPSALLELIAEIERRGERNVYWIDQANAISRDRATIRAERDQLKAENEDGLAVIRTLKEQLDCYMKDAERYRILRDERLRPGCLSSNPEIAKYLDEYMICGDKMDAVIDAEIAKEAI